MLPATAALIQLWSSYSPPFELGLSFGIHYLCGNEVIVNRFCKLEPHFLKRGPNLYWGCPSGSSTSTYFLKCMLTLTWFKWIEDRTSWHKQHASHPPVSSPSLTPISCVFLRRCSAHETGLFCLDSAEECGFQWALNLTRIFSAATLAKPQVFTYSDGKSLLRCEKWGLFLIVDHVGNRKPFLSVKVRGISGLNLMLGHSKTFKIKTVILWYVNAITNTGCGNTGRFACSLSHDEAERLWPTAEVGYIDSAQCSEE